MKGMSLLKPLLGSSSEINVNKENKWEDELDSIYKQISTRDKFKYDMNADALYKQYAQQYENNAKLAMQDTVGQISALTGGYGNSYAETAGQAMYNQQMQGLNDRALELYQLALNQYNAEGDRLMNIYGMTADQYNTEYNKIRDEVADQQWAKAYEENQRQYNLGLAMDAAGLVTDTALRGASLALDATQFGASLAFDASRALASDAQWAKSFEYQQQRDAASDAQWQAAFDYQKERDAVSDSQFAQELAYKYAKATGKTSTSYDGGDEPTTGVTLTYNDVVAYITNELGGDASDIITEDEFNRYKTNPNSPAGYLIAEGLIDDNYQSYLRYKMESHGGIYE